MVKYIFLPCLVLLFACPAFSCGVMVKADPRVGSTVSSVDRVTLYFTQAIVPAESGVKITDASGKDVELGKPVSSQGDRALTVKPLRPLAPDIYKVRWDVLWLDCKSRTQGKYKFTVGGDG